MTTLIPALTCSTVMIGWIWRENRDCYTDLWTLGGTNVLEPLPPFFPPLKGVISWWQDFLYKVQKSKPYKESRPPPSILFHFMSSGLNQTISLVQICIEPGLYHILLSWFKRGMAQIREGDSLRVISFRLIPLVWIWQMVLNCMCATARSQAFRWMNVSQKFLLLVYSY